MIRAVCFLQRRSEAVAFDLRIDLDDALQPVGK